MVFTFAGHGSWLPDGDRDEPDARDEMMCPFDVMKEQYLLDDDLYKIFCTKRAGARLYVIADCCHSGSVVTVRAAAGRAGRDAIEGAIPSPVRVRAWQPPVRARDRPRGQRAGADEARATRRCCSRGARTASSATTRRSVAARTARSHERPSTCCRTPASPRRARSMTPFENSSPRSRFRRHPSSLDPRRRNWVLSFDP